MLAPVIVSVRSAVVVALVVCLPVPADAIVNIEAGRRADGEPGVHLRLDLDLTYQTGNIDLVEFGPAFRLDRLTSRASQLVLASGDIGWEGGERFSNGALFHVRNAGRPLSRFRPEFFGQVNYDLSRQLQVRGLGGGGVRIGIHRSPKGMVWLGLTTMLEHERNDLTPGDSHPKTTNAVRGSFYFSFSGRTDRTSYEAVVYVQPRFQAFDDGRLLINARLGVAASERIELAAAVSLRHDAGPPLGIEKTDLRVKSGLSLAF